jgi:rhamnosyltransferase
LVEEPRETPESGTNVAIIMRSKDEQPYADPALAALASQSYKAFTLYNVDSGSTDGTLEAVKAFNPDPSLVFEIKPEEYVPGPVLNMMVEKTTEPIVVFLNADAIPQDDTWLETLLAPIFNDDADATVSKQIPRDCACFIDKYDFERAYYSARTVEKSPEFFSAVACAFRRELWEETKFYDKGYAEDIAWSKVCQEKGARFQLVLESVVEHSHNYTMKGLYRKRYRHGVAYVTIYDAQPNAARQVFLCCKELVRDLLYTLRRFRLDTIPYNIVHRLIIHVAYYLGERDERHRRDKQESSTA